MKTKFKILFANIPITKLRANPFFTPTDLGVKRLLELDKSKVARHNSLYEDFKYYTAPHVWAYRDRGTRERIFYILGCPEQLKALRNIPNAIDTVIGCQVICCPNIEVMKNIATRLQTLENSLEGEPYVARCLSVLYYQEILGYSPAQLRKAYGIKHARSAEGKLLERDRRLARHRHILKLVLGISNLPESKAAPQQLLEQIIRPQVQTSTLQYSTGVEVIGILRDDPALTEKFSIEYLKYLERLEYFMYKDDVTKPVYQRHHYNKNVVFRIAKEVARTEGKLPIDLDRIAGWDQSVDIGFKLKVNKITGDVITPQVQFNRRSKNDINIKKIDHLISVLEPFVHSLKAYWWTICPTSHGAKIRTKSDPLDPSLDDVDCNTPDYFDYHLFKSIWERRSLYYCNREWLLKSIELRAHHFGFPDYAPESLSSYQKAFECYDKWYKLKFEPDLTMFSSGAPRRQPRYEIYILLQTILRKEAGIQGETPITFRDFILEVFSEVMTELDLIKEHNKEKAGFIMNLDRDIKRSYWDRVHELLKHAPLAEQELATRVTEMLLPRQTQFQDTALKILEGVDRLTEKSQVKLAPYPNIEE